MQAALGGEPVVTGESCVQMVTPATDPQTGQPAATLHQTTRRTPTSTQVPLLDLVTNPTGKPGAAVGV
jgi:hypothetical protein